MPQEPTREEQYILDESPDILFGENSLLIQKIFQFFPALESRNYQIYFFSGLVSLIGTWLQIVAEAALIVYVIHPPNTALWVGIDGAAATLPTLLFALFGGVIVDRFPKKYILMFTQSTSMVLAFVYGFLVVFGAINIYEIIILAFLLGIATALDTPARQSFVTKLVPPEEVTSAIALSAGVFNAARVIGPALAGVLTGIIGAGGAFIVNGISYIPVILGLRSMKITEELPPTHPSPFKALKQGITYSFAHPTIRMLLIMTGITSIFGWSYTTAVPVLARDTFHLSPTGLGSLYAAAGLGALVASLGVSALSKKGLTWKFIIGGNTLFAVSIILFSFVHTYELALVLLFLANAGILAQFINLNSTIQALVTDEYRGRVMSMYTLMFIGFFPIGNLEVGYLSDIFGPDFAIRVGAIIVFAAGVYMYFQGKKTLAHATEV